MSINSINWYSTIRTKLILVIILSCTVVLGGLSTFNTINEQERLANELNTLADVTTQRLSKHLIGPMWDLDRELVEDIIESEMLENKIYSIIVWDAETRELFAARERGPDGQLQRSDGSVSGDLIKASTLVNNGNKDIGEVIVFVSKKELDNQLHQATYKGLVTLLILIAVMVTIIIFVLSRLILSPIKRLAKHADDISHGDLKQNIEIRSNDEIGQLADAFQRMQVSLRIAFKRLQNKAKPS